MNLNIGNIGVYGFRHYDYLKKSHPSIVGVMRMNGTLEKYIDKSRTAGNSLCSSFHIDFFGFSC